MIHHLIDLNLMHGILTMVIVNTIKNLLDFGGTFL